MARLKRLERAGAGPRVPQIGAPLTYVATPRFLSVFSLASLRGLTEIEAFEGAGLLDRGIPADAAAAPAELDRLLGVGLTNTEDEILTTPVAE